MTETRHNAQEGVHRTSRAQRRRTRSEVHSDTQIHRHKDTHTQIQMPSAETDREHAATPPHNRVHETARTHAHTCTRALTRTCTHRSANTCNTHANFMQTSSTKMNKRTHTDKGNWRSRDQGNPRSHAGCVRMYPERRTAANLVRSRPEA